MIFSKTALLAMTLLVLTGCVTDTGKASGSGDGMANFDGTYRLVDIDGKAIPGNAVLNIDGQSMFGQASSTIPNGSSRFGRLRTLSVSATLAPASSLFPKPLSDSNLDSGFEFCMWRSE